MPDSRDLDALVETYSCVIVKFIEHNVDESLSKLFKQIIDSSCKDLLRSWIQRSGSLYVVIGLGQTPEESFVSLELLGDAPLVFDHSGLPIINPTEDSKLVAGTLATFIVNCNRVVSFWSKQTREHLKQSD